MKRSISALLGSILLASLGPVSASTLTLDFDISFGDPLDPNTEAPDGLGPWMTAEFDDGGTAGSVTLTLSVAGDVGAATVTAVYLNVDDAIGGANLTITGVDETSINPNAIISQGTDAFKAGNDGLFDLLFELPPPGDDRFTAGETLTYNILGDGLLASSFNYFSAPDPNELDPSGPFLGAAKFANTGTCVDPGNPDLPCYENSDWVGAVPVPAAVWLFGSGLLGLIGVARRRKV